MKKVILVDIGSSSIKIYQYEKGQLGHLFNKTIGLKEGFNPKTGLSEVKKTELLSILQDIKTSFPQTEIHLYATAIFRQLSPTQLSHFNKDLDDQLGLSLTVIDHQKESYYLEKALVGNSNLDKPMLLMNIGGGSTELIVVKNQKTIETKNVDIGVVTINKQFPGLNDQLSDTSLPDVIKQIIPSLPKLKQLCQVSINTGGELTYMRIADYHLVPNTFFKDADHPSMITTRDFSMRNEIIYDTVTLQELEKLMPQNPKWMHGARSYLAIAQGLFVKNNIEYIIPSDSNLMNGIVRTEFNNQ